MNKLHLAILALALAVPLAAASGLRAAEQDIDTLRSECGKQLNLGESGCACIADTAAKELNDKQQALVAASHVPPPESRVCQGCFGAVGSRIWCRCCQHNCGGWREQWLLACRFVKLLGRYGWQQ